MQFTTIASIFAMAAVAIAAPADIEARGGWGGSESPQPGNGGGKGGDTNNEICSANNQQVCCTGGLNCLVQVLGSSCKGGNAYCCDTGISAGGLVNVALLNCLNIGGIL
ncbi:hypothetical protein NW762_011138 [Fusarium torreyae]|uniref:Hydrophobin n=1 Tax=Fusarium torreyae TaxID=1237075 RepID=A0A9W8RS55_9HYPO|nr:hypothetical protein NW762_011138 [Fusarium torreyae]